MKEYRLFLWIVIGFALSFYGCRKTVQKPQMVVLIGIDGMGADDFQKAKTPNLDELAHSGALSLSTRGVMPTVSAPNWASHLMGAGPEQHGVTSNGWKVNDHLLDPVVRDEEGFFPSVYTAISKARPEAETGFFYDWKGLADLLNLKYIKKVEFSKEFHSSFEKATPWILENKPLFSFIYVGHPDEVGHEYGWGSEIYLQALADVDNAIGTFVDEMKKAGIYENICFLVVSDHGGVGHGHGGISRQEMETPWIISGPGVISDRLIEQTNNNFNTAATILYLLEIQAPEAWLGKPAYGAFISGNKYSSRNTRVYVPQPFGSLESGLYPSNQLLSLFVSNQACEIRFTTDGSEPGPGSALYKNSILLQNSLIIKAASFHEGNKSNTFSLSFTKVIPVSQAMLENQPDEQYPGNGAESLTDLILAEADFRDKNWLGFRGEDLVADLDLGEIREMESITLRFLADEGSWIFLPRSIQVDASVNGAKFVTIAEKSDDEIRSSAIQGINEFTFKFRKLQARYFRVKAESIGVCPAGHAGEGEPAWLFTDEIIPE